MILVLSIILLLLLFFIGKRRGIKTFITLYLSLFLVILYIYLINLGINAIILAIVLCILVSILLLFILNGYNVKTKISFLSIMIVLIIITLLIFLINQNASIQGFSSDSMEEIGAFKLDVNLDFTKVLIGMYLVSIIGTIIDTSISITTSMNEVLINNYKINEKDLLKSGFNIGKDILSTTINTLYFALISHFIGFIMWHYGSSIEYLINYKDFAREIIQLHISFISSILIIPITVFISSKKLIKERTNDNETKIKKNK